MKKLKIISSIFLTTLLATSAVIAFVDLGTVNSSDPLTATIWNALVGKINENGNKLDVISNVGGNIGIGEANPAEKLDVNGNIKITGTGGSVTISVEAWNEMQKNITKTGYKFWTHNSTDGGHDWYGPGSNFRNCEILEYFQQGETIQNTYVFTTLYEHMGSDKSTWSSHPEHAKFLRDFALHSSYTDTNSTNYGAWSTLIYGPSRLYRCAVD